MVAVGASLSGAMVMVPLSVLESATVSAVGVEVTAFLPSLILML